MRKGRKKYNNKEEEKNTNLHSPLVPRRKDYIRVLFNDFKFLSNHPINCITTNCMIKVSNTKLTYIADYGSLDSPPICSPLPV